VDLGKLVRAGSAISLLTLGHGQLRQLNIAMGAKRGKVVYSLSKGRDRGRFLGRDCMGMNLWGGIFRWPVRENE